jgi:prolyl-tRNA editing enzyme YbaK/EbsC (Cys-tRNA(Pro) deacylase)
VATSAPQRFADAARERGLEVEIHHWPEGTRTAADAAAAVGCDVAQIVKSLVLVADDEPVVVLTSGANRVDTVAVGRVLAARSVRMADAAQARTATGFAIGGTPPFGYPEPLRVLIDRDLLEHDEVWAAAGTPDTTFPVEPTALRDAAGAEVADFAER